MNKILREEMEYLITCDDKAITPDVKDDVKMTLDYIDELEKENNEYAKTIVAQDLILKALEKNIHKLQDKLDKAIEYIENHSLNFNGECEWELSIEECKELEDILRGESYENQ